ncbi:MAG: tetratricopeptide repeat protein, partial [Spirochaetota bacterium]
MKKRISFILAVTLLASPLFAQGYHSLGRNAYVYRNYEKARELFLKDIEAADRGDSYYFLGEIEKIENNYDKAAEYFKIAVTKSMTKKYMVNAYWNLIIFSEEKNDLNSVVFYCKELWIKTGASSAKNKINSITNRLLWTNNQDAIEKYKAAMELHKKGNSAEAEKNFREAINLDRNFLAPKFELGMKAYKEQNENDALYYLGEITTKIPFYYDLQLIVGDINFKNRNYRTAANNFSNAIDYGFINETQLNNTLIKRGTCYFHLSNLDKAEEDIKKA